MIDQLKEIGINGELDPIENRQLVHQSRPQALLMVNSQYNGWRMEDVWLDR